MPTTQTPRGGRRGKHREKRLKMLEAKFRWLANDAPYGEYLVDFVAMELFLRCAGLSTYGEDEFVRLFREDVNPQVIRVLASSALSATSFMTSRRSRPSGTPA